LMTKQFDEETLLATGHQFQQTTDAHLQLPQL